MVPDNPADWTVTNYPEYATTPIGYAFWWLIRGGDPAVVRERMRLKKSLGGLSQDVLDACLRIAVRLVDATERAQEIAPDAKGISIHDVLGG